MMKIFLFALLISLAAATSKEYQGCNFVTTYTSVECDNNYVVHRGGWNFEHRNCLEGHVIQRKDDGYHCCPIEVTDCQTTE